MTSNPSNPSQECAHCYTATRTGRELKRCARCKAVSFCSRHCQKAAWPLHKRECKKRKKKTRAGQEEQKTPPSPSPLPSPSITKVPHTGAEQPHDITDRSETKLASPSVSSASASMCRPAPLPPLWAKERSALRALRVRDGYILQMGCAYPPNGAKQGERAVVLTASHRRLGYILKVLRLEKLFGRDSVAQRDDVCPVLPVVKCVMDAILDPLDSPMRVRLSQHERTNEQSRHITSHHIT